MKILAINGSYRRGGIIDQAVQAAAAAARAGGAVVETVLLSEQRVEFCTNCRACTQAPGDKRGACPLADDMNGILDAAEAAQGLILAAPVNCFNVSAVYRRFMERGTPYAYWPWGALAPAFRLKAGGRKAVLITSSAMPSVFGRLFTGALRALRLTARTLGAKVAGTLVIGLASAEEKPALTARDRRLAEKLGRKLL
ncbi:MAG: flavodoxin family protein [Elusimicrobiales bacterium]|nr:flavodoxin family protein [Elusimicrobiales bacterium]